MDAFDMLVNSYESAKNNSFEMQMNDIICEAQMQIEAMGNTNYEVLAEVIELIDAGEFENADQAVKYYSLVA